MGVLAAIFWGGSNTSARVGLQSVKAKIGICFTFATVLSVTLITTLIFDFEGLISVSIADVGWFALIGILNFALGNFFLYQAITYVGAARGVSAAHASPLFALIFATMFLGEIPSILVIMGTASIIIGVYSLLNESRKTTVTKKEITLGYGFGLGTALCWGSAAVIIKHATQFGSPLVILTFASLFALIALLLNAAKDFVNGFKINMKDIRWFLISGLLSSVALAGYYSALARAPVLLVAPIIATSPLFTVLFVHFFLQRLERITVHVVIACFLVVTGGIIIAVS